MTLLTKANALFDRILDLFTILAAIFVAFMMLAVTGDVTARFILGRSGVGWVIEISEYMLVYITFLGTAWLLKKEGHIKVDLVIERLQPRVKDMINIITSILGAICWLTIIIYSTESTWYHFQIGYFVTSPLRPPIVIFLAIIPVGSFLLFIQFLRRTYGYLQKWRASPESDQAM